MEIKTTGHAFTFRSTTRALLVLGFFLFAIACKQETSVAPPLADKVKGENTFSAKGSVKEMSITPETTNFPEHEGRSEFMSYCAICHSLRYITTQPDFSKKIWEEEVHKMVAKYSAPIDSATCNKIVDYLMVIKGAK